MTSKTLLLICNQFPFGYGETFISKEFNYLHSAFDKVVILSRTDETVQTRQIPNDVELFKISPKSNLHQKIKFLFILVSNRQRVKRLLKHEESSVRSIFKKPATDSQKRKMKHDLFKALEIKNYIEKKIIPKTGNNVVVYSYWQNSSALSGVFLKQDKLCNQAISRAHRGDLYFDVQSDNYLTFRKYISEYSDKLFFISDDGKKYQSGLLGQKYLSFSVSKLGTEKVEESNNKKKEDNLVLVSCSNIIPVKRVHLIVEALSKLSEINIKWVHFGGGILEKEIKKQAEYLLSIKKNICYEFMGKTNNPLIHKYYAENHVDLFINVSESEGIPVSIMEAMSYNIPVIATNVGGSGEIVDNVCGRLIEKNISNDVLSTIISEELNKKKKGLLAFDKWETYYCAEKNYTNFISEIKQLYEN